MKWDYERACGIERAVCDIEIKNMYSNIEISNG